MVQAASGRLQVLDQRLHVERLFCIFMNVLHGF
jgi:hypothetical protein